MGVVNQKSKAKKELKKQEKEIANGKPKVGKEKVKKKKTVSCLQCIKPNKNDGGLEGKYRVAAPELMQDTFMSDSEDEGGEVECPIQQQQQYRYMNSEAGTLHRAKPLEDSVTDGHLWPSNNDSKVATIDRQPLDIGFLVSFVVDARGGAMKAKRRGGVRIIVPPAACAAPTRVTCRAATRRAPAAAPPPLMEGEALASRLLELQPQGAKFLAPVIIEVPIFTSSCREREIVILRSDTGETWQDHYLHNNDNAMIQEALLRERQEHGNSGETLGENGERVTRIVTCDFPHYLAVVSRVRQEVHIIGPEGGTVSSAHIPQVQALFPAQALTKRIRVGLQAHGAAQELCRRSLPRHVAVSPVITVEPRRRKFHRSITLTAPLPVVQGGQHDKQSSSTLRLLCSIMGGQARAVWEDVTGSTPLTITDDCASFTTTVSARFWLMNCQNVSDATKLATELYRDMLLVPFEVRIVVLGKRLDALEGRLLVLYITDRYAYDTLLHQEHYTEVAHSTSVRLLDSRDVYLEFSGNLIPVTKSGSQPMFTFEAFKDNRVEFTVRVKHHEESPSGRIYFMNEPKVPKGEQSQTPACVLDVELPDRIAPRAGKSQVDYLNLDQSGFDALKDELSFHWGDHNHSLGPASLPTPLKQFNGHDKIITNGDVKYSDNKEADNKTTKPHVNGDSKHVDNKGKATFDSDEDKTPMNTLEKGKKKSDGFLGGLADKVKHVFSHEDSEEKESSPKPQPKPRDSKDRSPPKEKSPPKPAPRIINEDLLDKVDDMFKDLKSKPRPKEEEELQKEVYNTKLYVDETDKPLSETHEYVYKQYAHMQPVDTPTCQKLSDPFNAPCPCDKYKHSHEETSNVVDIIEHVHFAKHEIDDANQKLSSDIQNQIKEEKDSLSQLSNNLKDDFTQFHNDLVIKEDDIKSGIRNKIAETGNVADSKLDDITTCTKNLGDSVANTVFVHRDELKSKANELDFASRERAEQLYLGGHEVVAAVRPKLEDVKQAANNIENEFKDKTQDAVETIVESVHNVQDNLNHKVKDVKAEIKETKDNIKDAANEKAEEISETIENTKKKGKKEAKKKAKEGKNFFTGFVSNIFGEKDKLEEGVKGKIAKGKEAAGDLVDDAKAKKNEVEQGLVTKQAEVKKGAEDLAQHVINEKNNAEKAVAESVSKKEAELIQGAENLAQSVKDEKNKAEKAVVETVSKKEAELRQGAENLAQSVKDEKNKVEQVVVDTVSKKEAELKQGAENLAQAIEEEKNKVEKAVSDKANEVKDSVSKKEAELKQGAENLAQDIEEEKNKIEKAVSDKANEVKDTVSNKKEEAKKAFEEKTQEIGSAIKGKKEEIAAAVQDKSDEAAKALKEKKDLVVNFIEFEKQAALDKTNETKQAIVDRKNEIETGLIDKSNKIAAAVSDKTNEAITAVKDKKSEVENSIQSTQESVESTVHDSADKGKNLFQNTMDSIGNFFHSKAHDVDDAIHHTKENVQHTTEEFGKAIHDTKDSIEESFHETKDEAKKALENKKNEALSKKDEVVNAVANKKDEIEHAALSKKDDIEHSALSKKDEIEHAVLSKKDEFEHAALSKKDEIEHAVSDKKDAAVSELDRIRHEAEQTTEDIKKSAEEALNKAADKKAEIQTNVTNKVEDAKKSATDTLAAAADKTTELKSNIAITFDEVQSAGKDQIENFKYAANDKAHDLQKSAQHTFDHVQESALSSFDKVESSAKDKLSEARYTWEDVQSVAGDTFALKDDLGNSTQDTLRSFQSSAGNTFDSLDDSAREFIGGVQSSTAANADSAKELFGDVQTSFEGFQVSADNKLEDVKATAKDGAREVEARLGGAAESFTEGVKESEQAVVDTVITETDKFTSSLNDLGNSVFGSSGKGFMKDASTKLLESEKTQSSPSPHKKSSGIPKLKRKK